MSQRSRLLLLGVAVVLASIAIACSPKQDTSSMGIAPAGGSVSEDQKQAMRQQHTPPASAAGRSGGGYGRPGGGAQGGYGGPSGGAPYGGAPR